MKKQVLWALLLICLCLILLSPGAHAAETFDSGSCGENLTWTLDDSGTLTISGVGGVNNYNVSYTQDNTPWADYKQDIKKIVVEEGITGIGTSAFENCVSLTAVILADSVTVISERAFKNCGKLSQLKLGNGLRTLGKEAFSLCKSLTEVTLPDSLNTLGELVFSNCESLVGITIPDNVPQLGRRAFYECVGLVYISMPDTISGIDGETFAWCESLWHVLYRGNRTNIDTPHGAAIPNQYFRNATKHYGCTGDEIQTQHTEATCSTAGALTFTCALCGVAHSRALPTTQHTWKNATCTTPMTCSACNATMGNSLGREHDWDDGTVVQEPIDNQLGVMQYTCKICFDSKLELIESTTQAPEIPVEPQNGSMTFLFVIVGGIVAIIGIGALIAWKQRKA